MRRSGQDSTGIGGGEGHEQEEESLEDGRGEEGQEREEERSTQCRRSRVTGNVKRRGQDSVGGGEGQESLCAYNDTR